MPNDMNLDPTKLHNIYFVMRHGSSVANQEEIIVSDPKQGVSGYGLTSTGESEVRASAQNARDHGILGKSAMIIASDFARAKRTAEIVADILSAEPVVYTPSLRERFFGAWEKTHNSNYQNVWDADVSDHTHTDNGVESVADVLKRGITLIRELEEKYDGKTILLVSHGDTLQILQTAFKEIDPSLHRSLSHLKTAEIRRVN